MKTFDTGSLDLRILKGFLAVATGLAVLAPLAAWTNHRWIVSLPLFLAAGFIGIVGNRYRLLCSGVRATLSGDTITVTAPRLLGLRTAAPEGTFKLTDYRGVRVERVTALLMLQSGGAESFSRVLLIGNGVAPDLRLVLDRQEAAARVADDLAQMLGLPVETVSRPH